MTIQMIITLAIVIGMIVMIMFRTKFALRRTAANLPAFFWY